MHLKRLFQTVNKVMCHWINRICRVLHLIDIHYMVPYRAPKQCIILYYRPNWWLYPEWLHRQCVGLAFWRSHVRGWLSAASLVICSPDCTVQYVELRGYCPGKCGGCDQSIGSTGSDTSVRSWLWSTATRSSSLGYFSLITASSW